MTVKLSKAIGGYQGLEVPLINTNLDFVTARVNSARSAIKLILKSINAEKVWLPAYICDAVVDSIKKLNIAFEYYQISTSFDVDKSVSLSKGEYILVVNYFGMCDDSIKRSINRFGFDKTIVDCSQAYFADHSGALATVWSPRKFFGVPDGGLLYSDDPRIRQPDHHDDSSEARMGHLISRLVNEPERSYQKYLEAEQTIADLPVLGMSRLTERLLLSVDYEAAKTIRTENACYLHRALGKYNHLKLHFDETTAPLCYPFLPNIKVKNRSTLIKKRVFIPSYWPEVLTRVEEGSFAWRLVTNGLFLPCDQRYNKQDMERLVHLLAIK